MKHSPKQVIEICVYIVLIIAVIAWTVITGKTLNPFDMMKNIKLITYQIL